MHLLCDSFLSLLLAFLCAFSGVIERVAVVVHVQLSPLGAGSLTYYLPVLMTGMDDLLAEYSEDGEEEEEGKAGSDGYASSDAP